MWQYLELYGKFLLNQVRDVRDVHLRVSNLGFRRQPETRLRPEAVPEGGEDTIHLSVSEFIFSAHVVAI